LAIELSSPYQRVVLRELDSQELESLLNQKNQAALPITCETRSLRCRLAIHELRFCP
jgi:hypothetical protein